MKENKRKNSWHGFFWWISLKSDLDAISELCDPAHAKVLLHFDGLSALVNHLVHIKWRPSCTDSTCTGSRVGHRVLFRSERIVLLQSFKERNVLLRIVGHR